MFWWTGLAPWEFESPFLGSFISTYLVPLGARSAPRPAVMRPPHIQRNAPHIQPNTPHIQLKAPHFQLTLRVPSCTTYSSYATSTCTTYLTYATRPGVMRPPHIQLKPHVRITHTYST